LDPVTRTLKVRLRFDNPDQRLKPNMYARVSIYGRLKPNALSIPREALIPAPGRDRVVISAGDGKFHVHEVMTGLESGKYVEILAGISDGDEIVTSAQFLIDSEASLAGSIQRLESVEPIPEQRGMEPVFASGWVDGVDQESRRIRVSHGPIDVLGWPSMTMVFDVRPAVDLSQVKVGKNIQFELVQEHAGEYVIKQIISGKQESGESPQAEPGKGNDSMVPAQETPANQERRITARAVVRGVDPGNHQVKLEHEAIAELKWPAMTMSFSVDPSVALDAIATGQNIHFSMVETPSGGWLIDQIHMMGNATTTEDRNDD
jgi:Cu(I)/Ag(I) efflux system membrane fusion protein